jgi:hypothetical protein
MPESRGHGKKGRAEERSERLISPIHRRRQKANDTGDQKNVDYAPDHESTGIRQTSQRQKQKQFIRRVIVRQRIRANSNVETFLVLFLDFQIIETLCFTVEQDLQPSVKDNEVPMSSRDVVFLAPQGDDVEHKR